MAKTSQAKFKCFCCEKEYVESNYYSSTSEFYINIEKVPYCKQCIGKLYQHFLDKYTNEGCLNPEKKAVRRVCMALDIYFNDKAYNDAIDDAKRRKIDITAMGSYMKRVQLNPHRGKTYDDTIYEEEQADFASNISINTFDSGEVDQQTIEFFGAGFSDEDYKFLKKEYDDWTARHECNTKAQEEVFKRICFKQLEILRATRRGEDTKNLDATFQNLLDTAKLQPKQNSGEATAENQTLGTLIDKWENERPLPEIDEELKDVDKIGLYIDVFFKGHLAKMMGLKNGLSSLYNKYIKRYTVEKPEYNDEENSEVLFDAIFGGTSLDSDKDNEGVV